MLVQIFFARCQSSPDVPLGFIYIQNFPCLGCEGRVNLGETLGYVLMYGCAYLERCHL